MIYELALVAGLRVEEPVEGGSIAARYATGAYAHLPEAKNTTSLGDFLKTIRGRDSPLTLLGMDDHSLVLGARIVSVKYRSLETVASDPSSPEKLEAALAAAREVLLKLEIREPPRLYLVKWFW